MRYNILATLICLMMVSLTPASAWPLPYQPGEPVDIITQPAEEMQKPTIIRWRVTPEPHSDGSFAVGFSRQESGQSFCRLIFSKGRVDIVWEKMNIAPHTIQSGDLLIGSGAPVPCDVLPVTKLFSADEPLVFEVRRSAGGRTFVDRIQVSQTAVTMEEARKNGWLKHAGEIEAALHVIKAVNLTTEAVMIQQLWADGSPWWIYEETPYRRSWRVR